ncbi:hypothetical protein Anas_08510 [Armadillidium nasatum]|uniref:Uncharacterized protein n=1 Tax=Armadillidium nasatum TaxID=96803 RepID=A0A5N5TB25_9CRUS|nr:hypothetical protein Anas_08510 [Armadillidium nasatum]
MTILTSFRVTGMEFCRLMVGLSHLNADYCDVGLRSIVLDRTTKQPKDKLHGLKSKHYFCYCCKAHGHCIFFITINV